jgi:Skp family chaperone for outer membrane proteins
VTEVERVAALLAAKDKMDSAGDLAKASIRTAREAEANFKLARDWFDEASQYAAMDARRYIEAVEAWEALR